jgi:1-deoxy-D-xylulose-5-phosphate synthase
VLELLEEQGVQAQVLRIGYPDQYIEQGEQHELRTMHGLDKEGIAKSVWTFFKEA